METRAPNSTQELVSVVSVFKHAYETLLPLLTRDPYSFSSIPNHGPASKLSKISRRWLPTGWRRSALVNVSLISASLVVLVGILASSISTKSNFAQAWIFYTSDCRSTATANILLHLLVNVFSAGFGNSSLRPTSQDILGESGVYSAQARTVSKAAAHASKWSRLDPWQCQAIYTDGLCSGLKDHRNVVVVIDGGGWNRSDTWGLSPDRERFWDSVFNGSVADSLWYDAQCTMEGKISEAGPICRTDCTKVLDSPEPWEPRVKASWRLPAGDWHSLPTTSNSSQASTFGNTSTIRWLPITESLGVSHCLAETRDEETCAVALSRVLLLVVVLSVLSKLIISLSAVWIMRSEEPLVTLGDAIAAFICDKEDPTFSGYPTDTFVRRSAKNISAIEEHCSLEAEIWAHEQHRRADAIPKDSWLRNCWFWAFTAVLMATFLAIHQANSRVSK
ncbi:hypothetical protein CPLU01_05873 [Colletotrichum plurivorum]|uniref:DUF6536 domain-containing protein n=1 Tax=Colletotrichum plurivorum TaxID=2175906 RepID=A0A8H6NGV6_9PEZI|nr:hypothetical protein CPLU01_05873 [Colletotrichum plurivorum]